MIGVFDSGHGGLTLFRALVRRFPHRRAEHRPVKTKEHAMALAGASPPKVAE